MLHTNYKSNLELLMSKARVASLKEMKKKTLQKLELTAIYLEAKIDK